MLCVVSGFHIAAPRCSLSPPRRSLYSQMQKPTIWSQQPIHLFAMGKESVLRVNSDWGLKLCNELRPTQSGKIFRVLV